MSEVKSNRAWREECESLRRQVAEWESIYTTVCCEKAEAVGQLAAAQAQEQQLREALEEIASPVRQQDHVLARAYDVSICKKALARTADHAALDARLAQEYDRGYQDAKDKFGDLT